ncbi:carbohydrate kinase family protein [candidate division KSB1 bacterium]
MHSPVKRGTVALLGTVCLDEIRRPGEKPKYGFGGLFYSVVSLAQLLDKDSIIFPVCKVGALDHPKISEQFSRYRSVDLHKVVSYPGHNNRVLLEYYSRDERIEYSTFLPAPYTIGELLPLPDVRCFMVNFISGIEMRVNTFAALRRRLKVPVFVDLHSLFLGFKKNGQRFYRIRRDWSRWHVSGDIVQMNENEAFILSGTVRNAPTGLNRMLRKKKNNHHREFDRKSFGRYLLDRGARVVIITRGTAGSHVFWRGSRRNFDKELPAYLFGGHAEPTGCGDVFSAGYIAKSLDGADPPEAADFAAQVAGMRAAQSGSAELHQLRSHLRKHNIV